MNQQAYFDFHADMCKRALDLSVRKNQDYARPGESPNDPFAVFKNFRRAELLGICTTEQGFLVRMTDKFCRLTNLLKPGTEAEVKDESVEDTMLDIINYTCLLAAYLRTKKETV